MRRVVLALIVGLLALSATGLASLVVREPCETTRRSGPNDGACSPSCVTCGCCAQAAEPVSTFMAATPHAPIAGIPDVRCTVPGTRSLDILHVPRPRRA